MLRTTRISLAACALVMASGFAVHAQTQIGGQQVPQNDDGPTPTGPAGGSYTGPGDIVPTDAGTGQGPGSGPGTAGPAAPGPVVPGVPGPGAGSAPVGRPAPLGLPSIPRGEDPATWEVWWSYNRDRFLNVKTALYLPDAGRGPVSVGGTSVGRRRPDIYSVADRVLPILASIAEQETDPGVLSAALIAMARADAGRGHADALSERIASRLVAHLAHRQLDVARSAALALGIQARAASTPLLAALVDDSAAGRALCGRDEVPGTLRSTAAAALGLLARRSGREEVARYAVHSLVRPLEKRSHERQDLAATCAAAIGLAPPGDGIASDMVTGDGSIEARNLPPSASRTALVRFLQAIADDPERDLAVRAQCAAAVGRAAGQGPEALRAASIGWAATAATDAARPTAVRQGCAIALGLLGRPTAAPYDRAARSALVALGRDTDRLVRALALVAQGEIGGRARDESEKEPALEIQRVLLAEMENARSGSFGFAALALGILSHDSALVAAADGNRALKDAFGRTRSPSDVSALGLALGLRLDITSTPLSLERFGREGDPRARAALALGLGLAGGTEALAALRAALAGESRPEVARDVAIARTLLGDLSVVPELTAAATGTKSLLTAEIALNALSEVGDASALNVLADLARDPTAPAARRRLAVRALGGAADPSPFAWNEPLRAHAHYAAATETLVNGLGSGILEH